MDLYLAGQLIGDPDYYTSLHGDGTYIYTGSGETPPHLRAYTFNGSSFSLSGSFATSDNILEDVYYVANVNPSIGNNIITAGGINGIRAYSFNGTSFTYKAVKNDGGYAWNLFAHNDYIYLANGSDGLRSYYLWYTPFGFYSAGHAAITGTTYDVGSDGTYIYAASSSGLRAYSQIGLNLTLRGTISGYAEEVWCDGTYIYVNDSSQIKAYTFNGTSFTLVGTGSFITGGSSIFGDGTYIYFQHNALLEAWTFDPIAGFVEADAIVNNNISSGIWGDGAYVYTCGGSNVSYPVNAFGWQCTHL